MKFERIIFSVICLFYSSLALSQEIQIKSVNESKFPLVKVIIEPVAAKSINFASLFIIEKNDTTSYSVDSILNTKNDKTLCFLIDQDLTNEVIKNDIINIITDVAKKLKDGDLINVVLSAEKKPRSNCIYPLSFEFSDKPSNFIEFLEMYFTSANFSNSPKNMNCSIEQTLEFIAAKKNLTSIKYLIIISKIPYAGGQDWNLIQKKASDYGILFKWFSYTSKDDFLKTYGSDLQYIIKNDLDSVDLNAGNLNYKSYILSFYTSQNEKLNQFEVDYKGIKLRSTFEQAGYINFFKENTILIGIVVLLFILVLSFIANLLYTKRQMANSIKELQKIKQSNIVSSGNIVSDNFDAQKTLHGNSSVIPSVTISIEGNSFYFELKKINTKIGRQKDNDLIIDDLTISGNHATLSKEGNYFYIQDNGSTNGTYVNDKKTEKSTVKNGDTIRMGKAILTITY